jgi:hypothetical protein
MDSEAVEIEFHYEDNGKRGIGCWVVAYALSMFGKG